MEKQTLECQLFDWNEWDGDLECMIFYDPVLKIQIGKHPVGTKFDSAAIMYDRGILQLQNFGPADDKGRKEAVYIGEYKLKLSVGETISESLDQTTQHRPH